MITCPLRSRQVQIEEYKSKKIKIDAVVSEISDCEKFLTGQDLLSLLGVLDKRYLGAVYNNIKTLEQAVVDGEVEFTNDLAKKIIKKSLVVEKNSTTIPPENDFEILDETPVGKIEIHDLVGETKIVVLDNFSQKAENENVETPAPRKATDLGNPENDPAQPKILKPKILKPKKQQSPEIEDSVARIVGLLNDLTDSKFSPQTKETRSALVALLKTYSEMEIAEAIEFKCCEWGGDTKMCQYLTPSTLFRASNFEKYHNAATKWAKQGKPNPIQSHTQNGSNNANANPTIPQFQRQQQASLDYFARRQAERIARENS